VKIFLLGHGISYSRSPAMQSAAFLAAGLDWTYDLLDVPPAELPDAIRKLRAPDVAGANVTIPYKLAVMEHLDRLDADARTILVLHHLDGRGLSEVASILGIPVGTAKSRLFAARRALERALERER